MKREDVVRLQTALLSMGYETGPIDGIMGPKTICASSQFMLKEHSDQHVAQSAFNRLKREPKAYADGVDVSAYQGKIDWKKVADSGIKFMWAKCSEGTTHKNRYRDRNLDGARAWGLASGGYHYARPDTYQSLRLKDAVREAKNFLSAYGTPQPDDLVPALDLESGLIKTDHSYNCDWVFEWCKVVEDKLGCKPILYTARWATVSRILKADEVQLAMLSKYPLWWAEYRSEKVTSPSKSLKPWTDWDVWQWTGSGTVDGIGRCDRNRMRSSTLKKLRMYA